MTEGKRLNYITDAMANEVLITAIRENKFINSDFPFEEIQVHMGKEKITGLCTLAR